MCRVLGRSRCSGRGEESELDRFGGDLLRVVDCVAVWVKKPGRASDGDMTFPRPVPRGIGELWLGQWCEGEWERQDVLLRG